MKSRTSQYAFATLVSAACALLLFELGSFIVLNYYVLSRDPSAFYNKPDVDRQAYESYLRDRQAVLGWPYAVRPTDSTLDTAESRPIPSFPAPGEARYSRDFSS